MIDEVQQDAIFLVAVAHWCRPVWVDTRWMCGCTDNLHGFVRPVTPEGRESRIITPTSARNLR